jgi:hypothetical protein
LDLGHGLTIEAYTRMINTTRVAIESHNTLLSNLEESRQTIKQIDKALSEMSERMLSGIASVYGKNSMEYSKAGGSNRKRGKHSISQLPSLVAPSDIQPLPTAIVQESTNGRSKN